MHAVSDNEYCVNLRLSTTNLLNWLIHILLKSLILIHIQFYLIHNIYLKSSAVIRTVVSPDFYVKFSILRFSIISIVDIPLNILWNYQFLIWCTFCVIITFIESCYFICHKKLLFPIDARVKRQRVTGLCQIRQFGWPRAQCARSSKLSYQGTLTLRVILVIRQFDWLRALYPQSTKPSYRGEMRTVFADRKKHTCSSLAISRIFLNNTIRWNHHTLE